MSWFKRLFRPKISNFSGLVKKYGLEGKVDMRMRTKDGYTLFPIIIEGKVSDLPGEFIKELMFLLFGFRAWKKQWYAFKIGPPRTLESIQEEIKDWEHHCNMFWAAYD